MRLSKKLIGVLLILTMIGSIIIVMPVNAATSVDVTVTATPKFISISNSPGSWTINGLTGTGYIDPSTTYYSNPASDTTAPSATVIDADCNFTITNTSTIVTNIKIHMHDFSGGSANMTNGGTGTAGATSYGAYGYYSGMTFTSKVVVSTSDIELIHALGATTNKKWGVQINTQTDAWSGGSNSTATCTITAEQHT